jgi:hypothetical protein
VILGFTEDARDSPLQQKATWECSGITKGACGQWIACKGAGMLGWMGVKDGSCDLERGSNTAGQLIATSDCT